MPPQHGVLRRYGLFWHADWMENLAIVHPRYVTQAVYFARVPFTGREVAPLPYCPFRLRAGSPILPCFPQASCRRDPALLPSYMPHVFFCGETRCRYSSIHPERPKAHHLTVPPSQSRLSHRRYWNSVISCGIRTPSNPASVTQSCRRQQNPQHQAAIWRSRFLGQSCATGTTNPQKIVSDINTKNSRLCRCLSGHAKPARCSPAPHGHVDF